MKIEGRKLTQHSDSQWFCELDVGESQLESTLVFDNDGELQSFRIVDSAFKDLLSLCGLEGRFSKNVFAFIANGLPSLPWCFGDQDDDVFKRVRKHYGLSELTPPHQTT